MTDIRKKKIIRFELPWDVIHTQGKDRPMVGEVTPEGVALYPKGLRRQIEPVMSFRHASASGAWQHAKNERFGIKANGRVTGMTPRDFKR